MHCRQLEADGSVDAAHGTSLGVPDLQLWQRSSGTFTSSDDVILKIYAFHFRKLRNFPIFYILNFKSGENERGEEWGEKEVQS